MAKLLNPEEMTSRDYYFDSYAHFGIHEVIEGSVWMVYHLVWELVKYARWTWQSCQGQEDVSAIEILSRAADDKNTLTCVSETIF